MSARVLLIDRRPDDLAGLANSLSHAGYAPALVEDSARALDCVRWDRPAIILMGRLFADMFRDVYCRRLRQLAPASATTIVVMLPDATRLTAIRCLESGADDVVGLDIDTHRLVRRLRALRTPICDEDDEVVLRYGQIEMNLGQHKVRACGTPISLGTTSFQVLRSFLERPEQILSRDELLATCTRIGTGRSLYEHVRRLREAMAPLGAGPAIVTMPPAGYMLSMR